ncbi:MAG: hypothetical protein KGI78_03310 [Patescibacteria group bacterium]|nr:hypothetical protein [Patescibacteria group bacterium]MDE1944260.1 hypothetical protein [Patescibacteria group bacterium]MDE1945170.1 hypothetical protein [Patescibacteria group bacterium]MDE2057857.1 hypothetical protein [Patescibacteria group bacterium]
MIPALIIVGNARQFAQEALRTKRALRSVNVHHIKIVRACYAGVTATEKLIAGFLNTPASVHLLIYTGHGGDHGWALDEWELLRYSRLVKLLQAASAPLILINDSCRAGRIVERIQASDPSLERRLLIIAASDAEGTTSESVSTLAIDAWREKTPFVPPGAIVQVVKFDSGPPVPDPVIDFRGFSHRVVRTFRAPPSTLRWGAALDHHVYPAG